MAVSKDYRKKYPVCVTYAGTREHVKCMPLGQRWKMMFEAGVHTEDELARHLFHTVKGKQ